MIPLHRVFVAPHAETPLAECLHSGYLGQGDIVDEFEVQLGEYFRCSPDLLVTVNSATSGLHLALHMLDLPIGTGVLTTPLTCMATTCAIRSNYLTPIWVDVDPNTLLFDLDDLERKISKDVGAIMVVHFAGNPVDLDRLASISEQYKLPIIEDCAHAIGSRWHGNPVGINTSQGAVFSFQAIKPLTCGDGGLLVTPNPDRARRLRWYGIDRDDRNRPVEEWGYKFHMNNISASIGLSNLPYLSMVLKKYRENAEEYDNRLMPGDHWSKPTLAKSAESSRYLYPLLVDRRDDFIKYMKDCGIECGQVHSRNDHAKCFEFLRTPLPGMDFIESRLVCIPVGWWLSEDDREKIIECFNQGW